MPDVFDRIQKLCRRHAGPTMRGLASQFAPQICKGLLIEYLGKVGISDIMTYVEKDISLWSQMSPEVQEKTRNIVVKFTQGHIEWLTPEWSIDAIHKDLPRVASLFLGWRKARNWLDRQIIELHQQLSA